MNKRRSKGPRLSIEEATHSNMWVIMAIVEVLELKGRCTKEDSFGLMTDLHQKSPGAAIPEMEQGIAKVPTY